MICITVVFAIALASHGASFRIGPALPRDLMVLRGSDHPDTGKQCSDDQLLMILPQLSHGCPVVPNFYENPPCPFPLPLPISVRKLTSELQSALFKEEEETHLLPFVQKMDVNNNGQVSEEDIAAFK